MVKSQVEMSCLGLVGALALATTLAPPWCRAGLGLVRIAAESWVSVSWREQDLPKERAGSRSVPGFEGIRCVALPCS